MRTSQQLSLLVVESDPNYGYFIRKSLEAAGPCTFQIDVASRIDEAFQKLRQNRYHMLLVESCLQDKQGLELLKEMHETHMDLPFILMTEVRDDVLAREAIKHGVADLIIKSESQFHDLAAKLDLSYRRYCLTHPRYAIYAAREAAEARRLGSVTVPATVRPMPEEAAYRDEVTGVYNHSYLHQRLAFEFSAASRYTYPLACLFVDIDHFNDVNEKNGFKTGDRLLRECAGILFDSCRMSDIVARYGGEEFVILLPHCDETGALELSDRIRKRFAETTFFPEMEQIHLTVSIGVSSFPADPVERRAELLSFAKQAALHAKVGGRDRIIRYRDVAPAGAAFPQLAIGEEKIQAFQRRLTEVADQARRTCLDATRTLLMALDNKDPLTAGHSAKTAKYAAETGEHVGMSVEEVEVLYHAALLHDIGKLCIPDEVLCKEGKLTMDEYEAMKQHPYLGFKILKPIKLLQEEAILVFHHHEWYNGRGYPTGLKGPEIPLGSRIIAVIDAFDTLVSAGERYKKTVTVRDCVQELIQCSGTQFDPVIVKAFIEVLKKRGELKDADYNAQKLEELLKTLLVEPEL